MARLYAETDTPMGEIARRFSIGQSSVARIAQRQGARPRSEGGTPPGPGQATAATSSRARRAAVSAAEPAPVGAGSRRGRSRTGGQLAPPPEAPTAVPQASAGGVQRRFRVRFVAEQVIEAEHLRAAIEEVGALGATDITSIARED